MRNFFFLMLSMLLFVSCETMVEDMDPETSDTPEITFRIAQIEQVAFENTTRSVELTSLISRLSIAVFQNGTKVKVVNQSKSDASFGTICMQLVAGTYEFVVIGHNGLGNCTISSPDKITFQNNKLTDTFYYYGICNVTESATKQITLTRPVAMFRMKITEKMPSDVVQMKFYYTGGSSTFNAVSGRGCVNSKQTETFSIKETDYGKPSQFEIYTFPHEENDFINITTTALNKDGNVVAESLLENIYVQANLITCHTTPFFSTDSLSATSTINISNDGKWSGIINQ